MCQFHFSRITLPDKRPAFSEIEYLLVELAERCSSFMVDKGIGYQPYFKAVVSHADAEFDIFGKPVESKTTCSNEYFTGNTHIKASGLKPAYVFFPSADAA